MENRIKLIPIINLIIAAVFIFYIDIESSDDVQGKLNKSASFTLTNAPTYLDIPTIGYVPVTNRYTEHEGVHPDIVYFQDGWNGYKYWMSFTPFPNGGEGNYVNDKYENPCIIVSNDGINWIEPPGISNPITPAPSFGYNNDPDMLFVNDSLRIFYNATDTVNKVVRMYEQKSADGINWTGPRQIFAPFPLHEVSPTIVYMDSKYKMWYVVTKGEIDPDSKVYYRESCDGITWGDTVLVNVNMADYVPWHIDIVHSGSKYYGLFSSTHIITDSTTDGKQQLMYGQSSDGLNWTFNPTPILSTTPAGNWDATKIYRSTFIIEGTKLRVWYSAKKQTWSPREWHIGYTEGDDPALPVKLTTFKGHLTENSILIEWNTATEINNYGFQVQRSEYDESAPDDRNWEVIGMVEGHGNSSVPWAYSYTDTKISGGKYYIYRLKQIDFDGKYENLPEVKILADIAPKFELSQNYPNPFNPNTKIKFTLPEEATAKLKIYNIVGELLFTKTYNKLKPGSYQEEWNGASYPSGIYIYSLETVDARGVHNRAINKMTLVK